MNSPINVHYLVQLSIRMKGAPLQIGATVHSEEIGAVQWHCTPFFHLHTIIFRLL